MKKREILKKIILLVIVLYVFLLSIKLMGLSFKLFGSGFSESLLTLTTNPLVGLFIGILATSLVQSSSVTTSIVVGLAATGSLSIGSAIPIIMGANIGTSVTTALVSLGHITKKEEFRKAFEIATVHDFFNIIVVLILFPLEMTFHLIEKSAIYLTKLFLGSNFTMQFSNPLNYILDPVVRSIQNILINNSAAILILSVIILFLSLRYFVKLMKPFAESEFKHMLHKHVFRTPFRGFLFGILLTASVQSSSVSTSLLVPLAGLGIISIKKAFPYVLGANIGTTITALLAALVIGSPLGVTVALAHTLFNVFGSLIVYPMKKIPLTLSKVLAELSIRSKLYPFAYIVSTFYAFPVFIIYFFH